MLLAAVAAISIASQAQPPRLRTILGNGATILVEPMAQAKTISIQLWAASKGVEERPETHGLRHLMEHLLALGPDRDLDQRLETVGGYLRARTFRDSTQIEVDVPSSQFSLGMEAIADMLKPVNVTQPQIDTEAKIIYQEMGLREDENLLSEAAWDRAYGQTALDPFGDMEVIRKATPEDVEAIHKKQFGAPNLALIVTGPVDLDQATGAGRDVLGRLAKVESAPQKMRPDGIPGDVQPAAFGEARAALVPGFSSVRTAAALAAALAIGSKLDDCFVTYTPSLQNGLVVLGRTESKQGLGEFVDGLDQASAGMLFERGKVLAASWVDRQLHSPSSDGYIRGLLMCQDPSDRPEMMLDTIHALTLNQFLAGLNLFKTHNAVTVEGSE